MAGIYIHVPFCRQKCYYCDFYKTVNYSMTNRYVQAIQKEILLRKDYTGENSVETVYLGGGTPSVLTLDEISQILDSLKTNFQISQDAEITMEVNPDDMNQDYLKGLSSMGINRLSVGIQSFQNKYLSKMNRRHNSEQAIHCVQQAVVSGFENISIDLIYGLPGLTTKEWEEDLKKAFQLPVDHLSAYHLTYHAGTPFYTWLKKGTLKEIGESVSAEQFSSLVDLSEKAGFEQYEISNFARNKKYSRHNTSYWTGKKYLGLGPSAHSYNGVSRQWNISHLESYVKACEQNQPLFEEEILNKNEKYNEYIMTGLRTSWGISGSFLKEEFGEKYYTDFLKNSEKYIHNGLMVCDGNSFRLTRKGWFISDDLLANFMII